MFKTGLTNTENLRTDMLKKEFSKDNSKDIKTFSSNQEYRKAMMKRDVEKSLLFNQ